MSGIYVKFWVWVDNFLDFTFTRLVDESFIEGEVGKKAQKGIPEDVKVDGVVSLKFGDPKNVWKLIVAIDMDFVLLLGIAVDDFFAFNEFFFYKLEKFGVVKVLYDAFWMIISLFIFSKWGQEFWQLVVKAFPVDKVCLRFSFPLDKIIDSWKSLHRQVAYLWCGNGT